MKITLKEKKKKEMLNKAQRSKTKDYVITNFSIPYMMNCIMR